ncbi:YTH domain-containing family protein 3-like isoform X2 [Ananas comosus]|uniref:YTH domain-containing family protein n=1 Tax=Ananas comosus TaxID=4615 RepID=A0A6P5G4I7_ANACO|nr:YTH domain-containing family protein 3-like isoform X2 [Ananas comosus]
MATDQIDSMQSLEPSKVESEKEPTTAENCKEQPLHDKGAKAMAPSDLSRDVQNYFGYTNEGGEHGAVAYAPNSYAPQPQMFFSGGHENPAVGREEFHHNLYSDGLEVGPNGFYDENSPFMFHTGYGYSPHIPYGPYSPVMPPLPLVNGDIHTYSAQSIPFSEPYYPQQPIPPTMPYLSYPASIWESGANPPVDPRAAFTPDSLNTSSLLFQQITDWLSQDGSGSVNPFSPLAVPPQHIGAPGPFSQSNIPLPHAMNQRPVVFGSPNSSCDAVHSYGEPSPNVGANNRRLAPANKSKKQENGSASPISCNGCLDFLHELNRGPRASRPKKQATEENSSLENKNEEAYLGLSRELFITEYKVAMFFVIKSFSEDNIHKSIKYGVWASTPSGNKKLDSAYHGAKERGDPCPVFLYFSVNASGHFCGVAEMIGPVDFEKSVDFWQQNRWSGCFPVKWRIVKDVPNNLFRHIVLENNDNKPVSNSRDTQEVNLEQGLEMLNIFKNHKDETSILDDFGFYDKREKAILEYKQKQKREAVSTEAINRISENFSRAIQIGESNNAENTD